MKRDLSPLAALAACAAPYLPAIAIGVGAVAALAWILSDNETKTAALPGAVEEPEAPDAPVGPSKPPPGRQPQGRLLSGKFASSITLADLRAVFAAGPLSKADAVAALCRRTHCSRSTAYHVLTRRFAVFLDLNEGGLLECIE